MEESEVQECAKRLAEKNWDTDERGPQTREQRQREYEDLFDG